MKKLLMSLEIQRNVFIISLFTSYRNRVFACHIDSMFSKQSGKMVFKSFSDAAQVNVSDCQRPGYDWH